MNEKLVVQAEHDPGGVACTTGPHGNGPELEQLSRGALDQRIAPVTAPRRTNAPVLAGTDIGRADRAHRDQAPAVGPQVAPGLGRPIGVGQVSHGHRVGGFKPAQRSGTVAGRLAVHGPQNRDLGARSVQVELLGHRRVHIVFERRPGQCLVPGDRRQHPGLDLAQVGAHEEVAGLGRHRSSHLDRHVVQPGGGGHPSRGTVRPRPATPQPAVLTQVLVEPGVAVGGGHTLGLAPGKKGIDQRVRAGERPQPPRPRVGEVDPGPGQQRAHLCRAAQVDLVGGRGMAQHLGVALSSQVGHLDVCARARRPASEQRSPGPRHGPSATHRRTARHRATRPLTPSGPRHQPGAGRSAQPGPPAEDRLPSTPTRPIAGLARGWPPMLPPPTPPGDSRRPERDPHRRRRRRRS